MSNQPNGEWFYAHGTEQRGPVDAATIRQMLASGALNSQDLVWRDGMPNWQAVGTIPELQPAAAIPPPPPPPPQGGGYASGQYNPADPPLGYQVPGGYPQDPQYVQLQSKASTAMIVGIVSLVLSMCVCGPAGVALGIWAWTLGGKIPPGYPFSGQAKAGYVCGIIGAILGLISTIFQIIWVFAMVGASL